ncbi:M56 family metallopeptidase [Mahella australiensis]|uniref:Peptidase M56 BlaR1 n=1 Tax=Mahella australiensis (strain DSM 15567 / CIP 107919 / 50-1 BON) TaxID=697281 RepID=F4A0J5_MAHA5|nr:M56 family metallopeptidase [Mahella australiensis]AEE95874.1 peptidase M56 BlaR1 [Mahella australiensis 50-1 BON]
MNLVTLFTMVLSLSFRGSILSILIILVKWTFKSKLNANWHYYIWLLLIIRLVIPYAPESPMSIFNLLPSVLQSTEIPGNVNRVSDIDDELIMPQNVDINTGNVQNEMIRNENITGNSDNVWLDHDLLLSVIWLIGVAGMLLYILIANIAFRLKINGAPHCKDEGTLRRLDDCEREMNIRTIIPIIYNKNVKTPSIFGLLKPKLLLSSETMDNLSGDEQRYIFLHELAHLKRKDNLINLITMLVQSLHWFNPIVWYAFYKIREDCEVACDAYVLSRLKPTEYKKYGETIIRLINIISKSYWHPVTTGMTNNKSGLKSRIKMVVKFKKNSWKWSVIAVAVAIVVALIGLTDPKSTTSVNDKNNTSILSKNDIDFNKDLYNESLNVIMTDGRYYEETEPGPYMGSNWEGKYDIQLIDSRGNILSKLDLNKAFNEEKLTFQSVFNIEFDDYNNDSNIDFTIGQYASSNGNIYRLFTILPTGEIKALPIRGQSEIFSSGGNRYSKKFEKIDTATFKNRYYDNKTGEMVETYYSWADSENQFVIKPVSTDISPIQTDFPLKVAVDTQCIVDLNGDGSGDSVYYSVDNSSFMVNGAEYIDKLKEMDIYIENPNREWYCIVDIDKSDKSKEIALLDEGPSNDPRSHFFRFTGNKVEYAGSITDFPYTSTCKFNGDGTIVARYRLSILETWWAPATWELDRNGYLQQTHQDIYYPYSYESQDSSFVPVLRKDLMLYTEPDLKAGRVMAMAGSKVNFKATDNVHWVCLSTGNGAEGWFYVEGYSAILVGEEKVEATSIFENLNFAD